jgi:hypothetical protein
LIWPESAVPEFNDASYIAITNFIRAHGVWLILNADDVVPRPNATNAYDNDDFNAAFLLDPFGRFAAIYHKQKLVIFGEYIPLVRWLPFVKWFTPITGSFAAGNEPVQFELERRTPVRQEINVISLNADREIGVPAANQSRLRAKASPLICYEDMFPQVARRAVRDDTGFLVNLTNDGWFGQSADGSTWPAPSFARWKTACRSSAAATTASPAGLMRQAASAKCSVTTPAAFMAWGRLRLTCRCKNTRQPFTTATATGSGGDALALQRLCWP